MTATAIHRPSSAPVLSAQEAAIANGAKLLHGTATDRVLRMYEAIREYGAPRVTLDRAVLFTESFQATENQPLVLRWAKALKHFVEKASVTIFPDELIVGRPNTWLGRWGIVYPELDGSVMPAGVEMFRKNKGKPGDVTVTDGDGKIISEVLTPYWAGKDYSTNFIRSLPEETRFMLYGPDPNNLIMMTLVVFASSPMRHSQNWTPDFSKILTRGVKGIREEARAKLAALSAPRDIVYKKPFLDAVVMTCDAMTAWSRRYAQLARELAAKEQNPPRKQELLEIADVCEWVPENPARTFREALQAQSVEDEVLDGGQAVNCGGFAHGLTRAMWRGMRQRKIAQARGRTSRIPICREKMARTVPRTSPLRTPQKNSRKTWCP